MPNPSSPQMRELTNGQVGRAGSSQVNSSRTEERKFTRSHKRQMQKLAEKVDRITQADRRFFERRPGRQHRVRLAGQAEIAQHELFEGKPVDQKPGCRIFAIVRNTDLSETMARSIFEECATPYTRQIEAELRAAVEGAS